MSLIIVVDNDQYFKCEFPFNSNDMTKKEIFLKIVLREFLLNLYGQLEKYNGSDHEVSFKLIHTICCNYTDCISIDLIKPDLIKIKDIIVSIPKESNGLSSDFNIILIEKIILTLDVVNNIELHNKIGKLYNMFCYEKPIDASNSTNATIYSLIMSISQCFYNDDDMDEIIVLLKELYVVISDPNNISIPFESHNDLIETEGDDLIETEHDDLIETVRSALKIASNIKLREIMKKIQIMREYQTTTTDMYYLLSEMRECFYSSGFITTIINKMKNFLTLVYLIDADYIPIPYEYKDDLLNDISDVLKIIENLNKLDLIDWE
jgi:hypothetical protein